MGRFFFRREKAGFAERGRQQGNAGGRSDCLVTAGREGRAVDNGPAPVAGVGRVREASEQSVQGWGRTRPVLRCAMRS